jgi:FixJ family two-component response regulator
MTEKPNIRHPERASAESKCNKEPDGPGPLILVVDDDLRIRDALSSLLSSAGMRVLAFGSAAEFLEARAHVSGACLILDLQLPGVSGLDLQRDLAEDDGPPIVFISGHGDIPSSVRAMKAGAIEFLTKPFSDKELLDAIAGAIAQYRQRRQKNEQFVELRKSFAQLSPREREVLPLIVAGMTNKDAAAKLGIAEITIQIHRAQIVRKLAARSLPDLVRMAIKLGISSP